MAVKSVISWGLLFATSVRLVPAKSHCYVPSRPFPPPILRSGDDALALLTRELEAETNIENWTDGPRCSQPFNANITSFAIEITSAEETLWGRYHTAPFLGNYTDSEPTSVSPNTAFRIASISKVFTVLAVLLEEKAGRLDLRYPVTKYIPDLAYGEDDGGISWEDITLESLASQLSGIPREYGQDDLTDELADEDSGFDDPIAIGLPPVHDNETAQCGTNRQTARPCSRKVHVLQELIEGFKYKSQMFAPNAKATYSNVAFILLGVVLENVTGKSYEDLVTSLFFKPLGMRGSRLMKPKDSDGIIPDMMNDWGSDLGAYNSTGGLYSTSSDLSAFLRSVLTHKLLNIPSTNAWLKPHSFSSGVEYPNVQFAYGMPWEIFRANDLVGQRDRMIDLFTKSGGLSGYTSRMILVPEYKLGITVLVAGDGKAVGWVEQRVLSRLIEGVDVMTQDQTRDKYAGMYYASASTGVNSSLEIEVDGAKGVVLTSWISNGTDFLHQYKQISNAPDTGRAQLVPSDVTRGKSREVWRLMYAAPGSRRGNAIENCLVDDLDSLMYGGQSLEELVFWQDENGIIQNVELPAFRITLQKTKNTPNKKGHGENFLSYLRPQGVL